MGGKGRKFAPGESKTLPDYLAKHYAKHLTNRELLKIGKERDTSPKLKNRPDGTEYYDNANFNELFNKAYIPEDLEAEGIVESDSVEVQIEVASKSKDEAAAAAANKAAAEPEVVTPPADEDDDSEASFNENDPNNQ